jgi:hypothetical protein
MHIRSGQILRSVMLVLLACTFAITSNAQFTITIPKLPKTKTQPKPDPTPSATNNGSDNSSSSAPSSTQGSAASAEKSKDTCSSSPFFQVWSEDMQKTMDDIKSFTPGRDYFVRDFSDDENKYLKMALSASYRQDEEKTWSDDPIKRCVNDRLDELAAASGPVIGGYRPVGFTFGTPAEKTILKGGVSDIGTATAVYNIGTKAATWKIVKDDYGLPKYRVRYGSVWLKYPANKYCTVAYVNLTQDYAGGGTYNTSEAQFISWEFAGCPAK